MSGLSARLRRSRWLQRLARANLFGLLVVLVGVLLVGSTLAALPVWYGWLLGLLSLTLDVALVLGYRWARGESSATAETRRAS